MAAYLVLLLIPPLIPAFVLGEVQYLIALCIEDRIIRPLLLLPCPGLVLMAGGAAFYRFLQKPFSLLGPLFSEGFLYFLWSMVILFGILIGGGMGFRARRRR